MIYWVSLNSINILRTFLPTYQVSHTKVYLRSIQIPIILLRDCSVLEIYVLVSPFKRTMFEYSSMSPSLFCIYLDTLLVRHWDAGVGCHIGGMYLGAFGYADDVTLLAPSRQALQLMLDICEDFASYKLHKQSRCEIFYQVIFFHQKKIPAKIPNWGTVNWTQ